MKIPLSCPPPGGFPNYQERKKEHPRLVPEERPSSQKLSERGTPLTGGTIPKKLLCELTSHGKRKSGLRKGQGLLTKKKRTN